MRSRTHPATCSGSDDRIHCAESAVCAGERIFLGMASAGAASVQLIVVFQVFEEGVTKAA